MRALAWVLLLVVLALAGWSVAHAIGARNDALAVADSVHAEWVTVAARARALSDSLELEKERSAVVLAHLDLQRNRADSLAAVTAQEAAENEAGAIQAGETLSATLAAAVEASVEPVTSLLVEAEGQLADHLEADRRTAAAFRAQIAAISDARAAEAEARMVWEERAGLAEEALDAERASCRACQAEVEALRKAASPGFLAELWSHGKAFAAGGATALLFVLAVG